MASVHALSLSMSGPSAQGPAVVCIPQDEYERLTEIARQYSRLRFSLVKGGVDDHTLDLLSNTETAAPPASNSTTSDSLPPRARLRHASFGYSSPERRQYGLDEHDRESGPRDAPLDWTNEEAPPANGSLSTESPFASVRACSQGHNVRNPSSNQFEQLATRSIQLLNLPDHASHSEITAVVRGGMLLEVFLRTRDRSAIVSFVHGDDAQHFHSHVRKYGLFVRNKAIGVRWADRQFEMRPHVAQKIASGATRNLVIRRCDPNHTEQSIRDDLGHIHNLAVIEIKFEKDDCFISTNSINGAMFARTCMMSRITYRGSKFEWFDDECAEPLAQSLHVRQPLATVASSHVLNPLANRFEVLYLEDGTLA